LANSEVKYSSIDALARAAGVGRETLRSYEQHGLITPVALAELAQTCAGHDTARQCGFVQEKPGRC
jgi:hypothetical protein